MIKLTKSLESDRGTVIRVDGRLGHEDLSELASLLEPEGGASGVTLDLSGLQSMDREARQFLLGQRVAGCRLIGCSLYVRRLLEEA